MKHEQRGSTLIEVLIAIAVMGIAAVALLGGVMTGITSTRSDRQDADAAAILSSATEAVKSQSLNPYKSCATTYTSTPKNVTFPNNYMVGVAVRQWDDGADAFVATNNGCTNSSNIQLIRITVTEASGTLQWYRDVAKGPLG